VKLSAIIADRIPADHAGATGAVRCFAQPVIGLLGLVVAVRCNRPIEHLAQGERKLFGVLVQDRPDLIEQEPGGVSVGTPIHQPTNSAGQDASGADVIGVLSSIAMDRFLSIGLWSGTAVGPRNQPSSRCDYRIIRCRGEIAWEDQTRRHHAQITPAYAAFNLHRHGPIKARMEASTRGAGNLLGAWSSRRQTLRRGWRLGDVRRRIWRVRDALA
jgi:hypothetical protein